MKNFFRILFLVLCPVLAFGQGTHTGGGGSGGGGLTQVASLPGICAAGAQYQLPNGDIYTCGPLNVLTKTGNGLTDGVALRGLMAEYRILPTETVAALVDYSGNGRNATGTVGTLNSETINGSATTTIANNSKLVFKSVLTSPTAGGANWIAQ